MTLWQGESVKEESKGVMKTIVEGKGDVRHLRWNVDAVYISEKAEPRM